MPFQSRAQAGWAFATGQPFAKRWARQTGPYKRLPYKKRKKAIALAALESFVSSKHYDPTTAAAIAQRVPALPSLKGEQIAPGITRIHGNLCNVHGRYGPCDKALSGKKKPGKGRKPPKPRQTPAQRAQARQQQRDQNASDVAKQMADTDTGLSPSGSKALVAFAKGQQPDPQIGAGLATMGLAERAQDGSYRMTPTGRGVVHAMQAGDYQRAVDGISRGTDTASARQGRQTEHAKRQQDSAGKRASAQIDRALRANERAAQAKKRAEAAAAKRGSGGGGKKPAKPAVEKPLKVTPTARVGRSSIPSAGAVAGAAGNKPKPATPAKAPAKQIAPALQTAADKLSQGAEVSSDDQLALIRNGLAKLNKDGELILTAAGMRATQKAYSFKVFKDATGADRWVAQSSTAFQDRDKEIVSTKALADDCAWADKTGSYGPLRWWHTPGLDLGDCDFNAMHGRVLVESGTFRSSAIAQKVAQAAAGLEISLGFLHLPSEPDADGVFHHIRRFERSLVPRGKASNRFTAFTVKETRMFDPTKIAALKTLGFSDDDIAGLQAQAAATEKAATDQGVAYKADEPAAAPMPGQRFKAANGEEYVKSPSELDPTGDYYAVAASKAFPAKALADTGATSPVEEDKAMLDNAAEDAMDGGADDAMEEDTGGLTLSPEDLSAITDAINAALQGAVSQIMGGLDLEKKVAGHVAGLMQPYQATKDAEQAQTREQLEALQKQVAELTGDQPAKPYRASESTKSAIIADARLLEAAQKAAGAGAGPFDDIIQGLGLARPQ